MKLSQNFGLGKIMTRVSHALAVCPNKAGQYMWFSIQIRQGHQMKSVLSRPAETILATRTTDPDWRTRTLPGLGKDRNVFDLEELSGEIHRLVRPCLLNNLHPFDHAACGFLLMDSELSVLVCLAAFAYAEI